jgi:hypothetical protein
VHHIEKKPGKIAEESHEFMDMMVFVAGVLLFLAVVGIWYVFIR